ncbi:MAG: sigma-54-dependent transcriptional regulator [Acidobacteriota bacterium]
MEHDRILILEDEKLIRWAMRERLAAEGYRIAEAETGKKAAALLAEDDFDLLLLDHRLPDTTGMEVLVRVRKEMPEMSVVMMTAYGTVENAVQAMKLGAQEYLTKPVNLDELTLVVKKALAATRLRREIRRLRSERRAAAGEIQIISRSPAMRDVMDLLDKIIANPSATTLLIDGESGTGKNLVAKMVHYNGPRAEKPFINITCSAITETLLESELFGHERGAFTDAKVQKKGLLELAHGGTAFLDEISEMGPALQAKLLRFLEDQTLKRVGGTVDISVNVRIIAATNRNLEEAVSTGQFREDLYYRLKVIPIHLPALRDRQEDIPLLAEQWLEHFSREFHKNTREFTPEAMRLLVQYPWPGNVRELKNVIERILILQDKPQIEAADLPASIREARHGTGFRSMPIGTMTLEDIERQAIQQALEQTGFNQVRAAKLLGISRDTLRYRMKKFGFSDLGDPVTAGNL